jgi:hypothetical protein
MVADGRPLKIPKAICMLTICYIGNTMIDIKRTRLSVNVQSQIIQGLYVLTWSTVWLYNSIHSSFAGLLNHQFLLLNDYEFS